MKLSSVTVLSLSLAFAIFGASSSLRAQEASVPSSSEVDQCVKWMKATVPGVRTLDDGDLRRPEPAHFCSGIQEGGLGGWGAVFKCGQPAEQLSGTAPRYCASSGEIDAGHAWAAGFRSRTKYGSDLLDRNSGAANDSQHAVTFYSTNPVWMESLRLPAGMYELIPSKSPEGWRLAVAKQDEESSDAKHSQQYLGIVEMKSVSSGYPTETSNLAILLRPGAECPSASARRDARELHFTYESTDLFVCFRPDQGQEAKMSEP
jgi:hypothetical protein